MREVWKAKAGFLGDVEHQAKRGGRCDNDFHAAQEFIGEAAKSIPYKDYQEALRTLQGHEDAELTLILINELRNGEGDSVFIPCDNPEGEGIDNIFVEVNGDWTGWQDVKFYGHDLLEALNSAVASKKIFDHPNPPPQWPFPQLVNYPELRCPICGGTEHVDPLPGTVGRRCVKCCNVTA